MSKAIPILYVDLDGTVRHGYDELGHFVNSIEDVQIFPDALKRLRVFKRAGWRIVAITNQGGVSLGYLTMDAARQILTATYDECDGLFDKMIMCVHHPDADDPEFAICWCRKPRIGGVLEAALSLGEQHQDEMYPPHMALFVGDREEDRECALNANLPFQWASDWRKGKADIIYPGNGYPVLEVKE